MAANKLENAVGQSLMAIGLYTVNFEAMALSFKAKVHEYLSENDPDSVPKLIKVCGNAYKTFNYCAPLLIEFGVISQTDIDSLTEIRQRRNLFAHEGYNEVLSLTLEDIEDDNLKMYKITQKVCTWLIKKADTPKTFKLEVSPVMMPSFITQVARQIVSGPLKVESTDT